MTDSAPLLDIPAAPAPHGGAAEWFVGAGGAKLRAALFRPPGPVRGSMVISGGRTEPIEKYFELIGEMQARGFVVLVHDWRGQGLSARELGDRLKGHANGYRAYLEDFQALLAAFEARLPKPWVALGHSMGGALTLLALAHGESRFSGAILTAPMLGIRTSPASPVTARWATRLNLAFGRRGRYLARPSARLAQDAFEGNVLTHDRARFARHQAQLAANPDLALGSPTWGWLDFAFRACAYLSNPERLRSITIPVTIVSAEDERLVENAPQAAAARLLPQGRLVTVPGAYHEILMETDPMRNIFMKALDALLGRAAPEPAKPPQPAPVPEPKAATPVPAPAASSVPVTAGPVTAKPVTARPAAKKPGPKPGARRAKAARPATTARAPAAKPRKASAKPVAAKAPAAAKPAAKAVAKPAKAAAPKAAKAKPAAAKKPATVRKPAATKAAKPATAAVPAAKKPRAARKPDAKKPGPKPKAKPGA